MAVTPWRARDWLRRRVVPRVGNRRTDWPVYKAILFNLNDKKVKFPSSERSVEKPPDCQRSSELAAISKSNSTGRVTITDKPEKTVANGNDKSTVGVGNNRGYPSYSVDVREYRLGRGLRKFSNISEANDLLETLISNFEARFGGQVTFSNNTNKPMATNKFKTSGDKSQISSPLCENKEQMNSWEKVVEDKTKLIEMHAF